MATTQNGGEGSNEAPNNLDDLFNYDVGIEDILNDVASQANNASSSNNQSRPTAGKDTGAGLGLDEEVTVTKKRKPTVKFDETRLLSQAGIPKLRKTAKTKLKFKGKGHEFSDAARLLNFYQLWLDDLFPRAKFADGLSMIEKLGHSKRIQVMRREWIDEGKPRLYYENEDNEPTTTNANVSESTPNNASAEQGLTSRSTEPEPTGLLGENTSTLQPENSIPSIFGGGANTAPSKPSAANDDDDGLFCTDEEDNNTAAPKNNDAVPEEDDLDALLAEHDVLEAEAGGNPTGGSTAASAGPGAQRPPDDEFEDEMEAMAGMDNPW